MLKSANIDPYIYTCVRKFQTTFLYLYVTLHNQDNTIQYSHGTNTNTNPTHSQNAKNKKQNKQNTKQTKYRTNKIQNKQNTKQEKYKTNKIQNTCCR